MSEQALSREAMLQSLRDIRLPPDAAGGLVAEIAVAAGIGALAALAVAALVRLASVRRRGAVQAPGPKEVLATIRALPAGERRVALLHFLRARSPEVYAALRGDLYQPGGGPELARLEAEAARLV